MDPERHRRTAMVWKVAMMRLSPEVRQVVEPYTDAILRPENDENRNALICFFASDEEMNITSILKFLIKRRFGKPPDPTDDGSNSPSPK